MCQKMMVAIIVRRGFSTHEKSFARKFIVSTKSCPRDCCGFSHSLLKCQNWHNTCKKTVRKTALTLSGNKPHLPDWKILKDFNTHSTRYNLDEGHILYKLFNADIYSVLLQYGVIYLMFIALISSSQKKGCYMYTIQLYTSKK